MLGKGKCAGQVSRVGHWVEKREKGGWRKMFSERVCGGGRCEKTRGVYMRKKGGGEGGKR